MPIHMYRPTSHFYPSTCNTLNCTMCVRCTLYTDIVFLSQPLQANRIHPFRYNYTTALTADLLSFTTPHVTTGPLFSS